MDGLSLLIRAQDAGLRLEAEGNALKITGPKHAEPLVKSLAEHKTQVLEALANTHLRKLRELRKCTPGACERIYLNQSKRESALAENTMTPPTPPH